MADPSTAPPLTPSSIIEAHAKIKSYIHETPLLTCKTMNSIASHPTPSAFLSSNPPPLTTSQPTTTTTTTSQTHPTPKFNLYFKLESQQKIGAFKARGAHHALIRLISNLGLQHVQSVGVTTHSSGNHAQALALAAHNFNVPSYIVMPTISTPSKIAGTRMYTDNVILCGSNVVDRENKVAEVVKETGAILVPPYDHPDIILGQGTAAYEMERQFQEIKKQAGEDEEGVEHRFDAVLTPLGGGGLLGGTATWFSHTSHNPSQSNHQPSQKRTLVIGTEPSFSGANDGERGLASSPPTRIPHVSSLTIADGLRTPVGQHNWRIISDKSKVEAVYSVSEAEIAGALRLLMERAKVFVEPSAAVPVAVVLFNEQFRRWVAERQQEEGGRAWDVGIVLSGGNTTVEALAGLFGKVTEQKEEGVRELGTVGVNGERRAVDVAG